MSYERKVRQLEECIREFCIRLRCSDGEEFEQIARELLIGIDLMKSTWDGGRNSRPAMVKKQLRRRAVG